MYVIICACEDGYEYKCLYMNCDQIANQEVRNGGFSVLSVKCVRARARARARLCVCSVLYSSILDIRSSDVIQCSQKGLHPAGYSPTKETLKFSLVLRFHVKGIII